MRPAAEKEVDAGCREGRRKLCMQPIGVDPQLAHIPEHGDAASARACPRVFERA
jgi:hypothetical protein